MRQAGVMLVIRNGFILGITRRTDKTKYGLPGGKFDPEAGDKDTRDTAIRETFEETGILVNDAVEIYQRVELGDGPNGEDFYSTCYYAEDWEGDPQDSEEGSVMWLTPDEVTTTRAAFGDYNKKTLDVFRTMYPMVGLSSTDEEVIKWHHDHIDRAIHPDTMKAIVYNHNKHLNEFRLEMLALAKAKRLPTWESDDVTHHPWAKRCTRCGRWEIAENEMDMYGPYYSCGVCDKREPYYGSYK